MLSRLNKIFSQDAVFYFFLILLSGLRVITSKVKACPAQFDCESYLAMMQSIQYDPSIPGHHAMRILPSLLAKAWYNLGFSATTAFQIVSGSSYCLLGLAVYWVLRKLNTQRLLAFAFALLCLAPHHAMRISLQLVYQSCDMMAYLFTLGIIYASLKKQRSENIIFIFSFLGIITRQNLFILGELSLIYCLFKEFKLKTIVYSVVLAVSYFSLQIYYQASGVFADLLHPPAGYFTISHLTHIFIESGLLALLVPVVPFLLISFREIFKFFKENWHLVLYMGIVVGQPMLGYHLTGANFQRLALQGVWVLFLACALSMPRTLSQEKIYLILIYALAVYFMWGMPQRLILAGALCCCLLLSRKVFGLLPRQTQVS